MSTLSTHVLDTSTGRPARRRPRHARPRRRRRASSAAARPTSTGGSARSCADGVTLVEGTYTLRFAVGDYFARGGREAFYPEVAICFHVAAGDEHYHVPLLLSPFGYSTYRGC